MPAFGAFVSLAFAAGAAATGVWTTPHDSYSSSVGVLGCKINTNRVAYWPGSVGCNNICVKLTYGGRSVHLLRIDQSGGAYDISYDAWVYLQTGQPASANPISGGTVAMDYEEVDASQCADLILTPGNKLPLSAANSINYLASCLSQPGSWVANNHVLYNICDAICSLGQDEVCTLDLSVSNQPSCPHTLGLTSKLTTAPVYDVKYQTGKTLVAGSGAEAPAGYQPVAPPVEPPAQQPSYSVEQPSYPVALTPTPAEQATFTPGVFKETYSAVSVPTETPTSYPVATYSGYSNGTVPSYTPSPVHSKPTTMVYSTMVITASGTTKASSSPTGKTPVTVNAGPAGAQVPVLALVPSIIVFFVLGAF